MISYFGLTAFFSIIFVIIAHCKPVFPVKYILLLSLFIRICITFIFSYSLSSDIYSFLTTGHVLINKVETYPAMYFPFIFYLGAFSLFIGKYIAPLLFLKVIFSFFDVGVTYFIIKLSKNPVAGLLYAVNPVMLIIIAIHGQMDSLPLFFLLWSIYKMRNKENLWAAVLLGIAIAIKPWPIIFLPVFLKRTKKLFVFTIALLIPAITVIIHSFITHVSVIDILTPIKNYRGIYGIWGIGNIMYSIAPVFWDNSIQFFRRIFLISFAIWIFIDNHKDFVEEFFISVLVFFVFSPLFGVQWVSWIIPFIIIYDAKSPIRIILMTLYVCLALLSDITESPIWYGPVRDTVINSISLIVWLSLCFLLLSYRHTLLNRSLKKSVGDQH